ncbi:hypothetical protein SAMN06296416_1207 [Pseudoxanthomonas wuyuanensis]|uniref:Uncharacterized protein n=1 Tax=Pseudoxanthomonas wuyuanensis TaxID=1073196 RepID=A0A286DGZ1_9GAMM|nr:hypothetical protein SAMN06296416_1207 [Pseudoxanthomonas wuyuanensis]
MAMPRKPPWLTPGHRLAHKGSPYLGEEPGNTEKSAGGIATQPRVLPGGFLSAICRDRHMATFASDIDGAICSGRNRQAPPHCGDAPRYHARSTGCSRKAKVWQAEVLSLSPLRFFPPSPFFCTRYVRFPQRPRTDFRDEIRRRTRHPCLPVRGRRRAGPPHPQARAAPWRNPPVVNGRLQRHPLLNAIAVTGVRLHQRPSVACHGSGTARHPGMKPVPSFHLSPKAR